MKRIQFLEKSTLTFAQNKKFAIQKRGLFIQDLATSFTFISLKPKHTPVKWCMHTTIKPEVFVCAPAHLEGLGL